MVVAQRGRGGVSRGGPGPCPCDIGRPVTDERIDAQDGTRKGTRDLGENKVSPGSNCHVLVGKWSEMMGLTHPHLTPTQIFILGNPYTCLFNLELDAETHHPFRSVTRILYLGPGAYRLLKSPSKIQTLGTAGTWRTRSVPRTSQPTSSADAQATTTISTPLSRDGKRGWRLSKPICPIHIKLIVNDHISPRTVLCGIGIQSTQ